VKQLPVLADVPKGAGTIKYPRPVEAFHQIEVTTFCNLRCVYCPSRHLDRPKYRNQPKQDMELAVYERALEWCSHFAEAGTQKELSITGIGETLMHPEWRTMVRLAREALPEAFINFSTNGLLLDDEACEVLAEQSCGGEGWASDRVRQEARYLGRPERRGGDLGLRLGGPARLDCLGTSRSLRLARRGLGGGARGWSCYYLLPRRCSEGSGGSR
jgi:hypothetical protein